MTWWSFLTPLIGGVAALVWALVADQGLGDVKLSAIGAWLGHFGVLPVLLGIVLGQTAVVIAFAVARLRRREAPATHPTRAWGWWPVPS